MAYLRKRASGVYALVLDWKGKKYIKSLKTKDRPEAEQIKKDADSDRSGDRRQRRGLRPSTPPRIQEKSPHLWGRGHFVPQNRSSVSIGAPSVGNSSKSSSGWNQFSDGQRTVVMGGTV